MIEMSLDVRFEKAFREVKSYKLCNKANIPAISDALSKILNKVKKSVDDNSDINMVWEIFKNDLKGAVKNFVPECLTKTRNSREPLWFNNAARKATKSQKRMYNKFRKSNLEADHIECKRVRRYNKKMFRRMKQDYFYRTCISH